MKDVMIDIETFGKGSKAAICQIAACYFDRNTGDIGPTFKRNIDAKSCVDIGAEMEPSTIYWWLSQGKEAQASVAEGLLLNVKDVFISFNDFISRADCIWSHATFDFPIVMGTYEMLRLTPSFKYWQARDIRTLIGLGKVDHRKETRDGTHHDALDDAIFQAKYCAKAFRQIRGKM